jgi:erythromycin esterase-like protein
MAASPSKIDRLILAIANGESVADAARAADVSLRSAQRYLSTPAAKARIAAIRDRMFAEAVNTLAATAGAAARAMAHLIDSADERVRLAAAKAVLELGPQLNEWSDVAQRLSALERRDQQRYNDEEFAA